MKKQKKCRGCEELLPIEDFEKTNRDYKTKCKKCNSRKHNMWNNKPKGYNWLLGYAITDKQ